MKILYITTIGGTMNFFKSFIRELLDDNNTVDIATNMLLSLVPEDYRKWGCNCFQISCTRNPLCKGNILAIREIEKIVMKGQYDIVHCHTPIAAACARLACRNVRIKGTKVIYTAHGFHFYNGAPLKNWLFFYPVEKWLSKYTDMLITINKEDYSLASKNFYAKKIVYVPGVGVDTKKFAVCKISEEINSEERKRKRDEINVPFNAKLLISVGELSVRKNHRVIVEALNRINDANIYYIIAGKGVLKDELIRIDQTGRLKLLGHRTDIASLLHCSDLFVFPSLQEGLPVSLMEAMNSGLPCLASKIRGNTDLLENIPNALVNINTVNEWEKAIRKWLKGDFVVVSSLLEKEVMNYRIDNINKEMHELYKQLVG